VSDALGFAQLIAQDEGVEAEWQRALASGEETFVRLPRQIPVRFLYQTVLFGDDGTPIIRNDPYNWNDRVAVALGFGASNALGFRAGKGDVGP
jgi:murein L,D-transpeptidase YcbB/YkuD